MFLGVPTYVAISKTINYVELKKNNAVCNCFGCAVFIPNCGCARVTTNIPIIFHTCGTHKCGQCIAPRLRPDSTQCASCSYANCADRGGWLLSLGYPLLGDLSLDGCRSENWTQVSSAIEAVEQWKSDEPHLNTMISTNRSDIGVGIAPNGEDSYIFVLETALQTNSDNMQNNTYPTLTAIAMDQVAVYGDTTQAAQSLLVSQYIMPVIRATARPDGDVIHEVKNGQNLWSIAIEYEVKIEQIRRLNNLSSTDIRTGQKLLVQKGATQQPMPTSNVTETPPAPMAFTPQAPVQFQTSTPQPTEEYSAPDQKANTFSFGAIAFAALFLGGIFTAIIKKKD